MRASILFRSYQPSAPIEMVFVADRVKSSHRGFRPRKSGDHDAASMSPCIVTVSLPEKPPCDDDRSPNRRFAYRSCPFRR